MAKKHKAATRAKDKELALLDGDAKALLESEKKRGVPEDVAAAAKASVKEPAPTGWGGSQVFLFQMALRADEAPMWWTVERDAWLRSFWSTAPFLPGVIYSIATRNAAFRFEFTGPDAQVQYAKDLTAQADLGAGWQSFIMKLTQDLLTQDNGAFIEVIRPARVRTEKGLLQAVKALDKDGEMSWHKVWRNQLLPIDLEEYKIEDSQQDPPLGIAHLDAGRCQRTGDIDYPVIYRDRKNKKHKLAWWQVITLEDMPSPIEDMNDVGFCAVSRILRAAQILRDVSVYKQEKISGRFAGSVWLTNVDATRITDAVKQAKTNADQLGLSRYMPPIIASVLDPKADPKALEIALASLPDGFDEEIALRWYITEVALGTGVDYTYLAPLPGQGLGTASQVETMARQTKGKSSRLFMAMLEFKFRYHGLLPGDVSMEFVEVDAEEEETRDAAAERRAKTRSTRILSGEINPQIARQIAVDDGDLNPDYLEQISEEDVTPELTESPEEEATDVGDITEESQEKSVWTRIKALGDRLQLRRKGSGYEDAVNAYAERLVAAYDEWAEKWAGLIAKADLLNRDLLIRQAANEIDDIMQGIAKEGLSEAYMLGLFEGDWEFEDELSYAGYVQVQNYTDRNLRFLEFSLNPDVQTKLKGLGDEGLKDAGAVLGVLGTFRGRVATYAGPYWVMIWKGTEERVKTQGQAQGRVIKVTRHSDSRAEHCDTCPPKAGAYKSWDEMIAECGGVPADGSDDCGCNCRCWIALG